MLVSQVQVEWRDVHMELYNNAYLNDIIPDNPDYYLNLRRQSYLLHL